MFALIILCTSSSLTTVPLSGEDEKGIDNKRRESSNPTIDDVRTIWKPINFVCASGARLARAIDFGWTCEMWILMNKHKLPAQFPFFSPIYIPDEHTHTHTYLDNAMNVQWWSI